MTNKDSFSLYPVHSFMANSTGNVQPSSGVIHFDKRQNLIWFADKNGIIKSRYPKMTKSEQTQQQDLEQQNGWCSLEMVDYTSINLKNSHHGSIDKEIIGLDSIDQSILILSPSCISMRKKTGLNQWTFNDPTLTAKINCLVSSESTKIDIYNQSYSRNQQHHQCYFGGSQKNIVCFDCEIGKVVCTRERPSSKHTC